MAEAATNAVETETAINELDLPLWAVISFERCEGADLTYAEAARLLADLEAQGVTGLCLVTNDSARQIPA